MWNRSWLLMQTCLRFILRPTLTFPQASVCDLSANVTLSSKHDWLLLFCSSLPAAARGGWGGGRGAEWTSLPPPPPDVSTIINSATVAPLCWFCKAVREWNHSKAAPPAHNKVSVAAVKRVISKCVCLVQKTHTHTPTVRIKPQCVSPRSTVALFNSILLNTFLLAALGGKFEILNKEAADKIF